MPSIEQRKLDVFARGSTRQEIKALENKPEFTVADIGQLIAIQMRDIGVIEEILSAGRRRGFPCCWEVAAWGALICPVIPRSFSPNPSNISVVVPPLMPVLFCTGSALPPRKTKPGGRGARGPPAPPPPGPPRF